MIVPLIVLATLKLVSGDDSEIDWENEHNPDEYKRLYNFGLGKRAYSYVSEYKRLPVYNFGLGKRSPRQYNFGLGKRDEADDLLDQEPYSKALYAKRMRPYNFGLGKRSMSRQYNFGLGKRSGRLYSFGLGKRFYPNYGPESIDETDEDYINDLLTTEENSKPSQIAMSNFNKLVPETADLYESHRTNLNSPSNRPERSLQYGIGVGKRNSPVKEQAASSKETAVSG